MILTIRPLLLPAAALLFATGGCAAPHRSGDPIVGDNRRTAETSEAGANRFQDAPLEGRTAVQSAIELSEKYARLSDQMVSLREENQRLAGENDSLKQEVASLDTKLKQTQKELNEANDLLLDMLTELNNWKNNILGFRGEMRNAARAQLEALLKVLEILGGEAEAGTLGQRAASALDTEPNQVAEPNESAVTMTGDPNATQ